LTGAAGAGARPVTQVAVGVLVRADGAVLLADRPPGKPYAGHWEFPGGKIEPGETVEQALERELREELGVRIEDSQPWTVIEHDYPHAYVRLHFRRIHRWSGTPRPLEGQRLVFLAPGAPPPAPLLPAAVPPLRWLQLPPVTSWSAQTAATAEQALQWLDAALARGLRQILWHEPALDPAQRGPTLAACAARARAFGARLLVDSRTVGAGGAPEEAADGCYLAVDALRAARVRPDAPWVGAGVRDRADRERAAALGCDFAVVESDAAADGVAAPPAALAELCRATPLPLYLPRPLGAADLDWACRAGAQGLAVHWRP
jgi:8-oxo-dGTP diphosphatase